MNIILCGMPCSGKTYFGKMTAERLSLNFIDTDELMVSEYIKMHNHRITCREIMLKEGESFFRTLESKVIEGLKVIQKSIIATGGGALCSKENILHLKTNGCLVYLKTSPKIILERLMNKKSLPSYLDKDNIEQSFKAILEQRLSLYEKHCHCIIDTANENVIKTITTILSKEIHHGE